jgi:hypothetical protein
VCRAHVDHLPFVHRVCVEQTQGRPGKYPGRRTTSPSRWPGWMASLSPPSQSSLISYTYSSFATTAHRQNCAVLGIFHHAQPGSETGKCSSTLLSTAYTPTNRRLSLHRPTCSLDRQASRDTGFRILCSQTRSRTEAFICTRTRSLIQDVLVM